MAAASSRAHLINQLSRSRGSSPREEEYATATSFDAAREAINSTMPMPDLGMQPYQRPSASSDLGSEAGSEGSAEMSIELGRGVKRNSRDADVSSNAVFRMGNDSLYEVTGTPPTRPRDDQWRADEGLRRHASIRRATETVRTSEGMKRTAGPTHRSLSEALKNIHAEEDTSLTVEDAFQHTSTYNSRNTRFARSRQTSATEPAHAPRATASHAQPVTQKQVNNPTVQSNSFILPDLPNITELVAGIRKDGTPVFSRNAKSRSRFTSGSRKAKRPEYHPIEGVPIPDEEKAVFASLQLLKDRCNDLEMERSEAHKRAEEYETEIIDLRSQLAVAERRPDSGLGSDEESSGKEGRKAERSNLQASVHALQQRLDRSDRNKSVSEIHAQRIAKERDSLITQIGVAYYNNEELKIENEVLRDSHAKLLSANEDLRDEIDGLQKENQELRLLMAQTSASRKDEIVNRERKEAQTRTKLGTVTQKESNAVTDGDVRKKPASRHPSMKDDRAAKANETDDTRLSLSVLDDITSDNLATRISQEVERHRAVAAAGRKSRTSEVDGTNHYMSRGDRSRSKSAARQSTTREERRRSTSNVRVSARQESQATGAAPTLDFDFTRPKQDAPKRVSLPSPIKRRASRLLEEDEDHTLLSPVNTVDVAALRKKLEEEHRAHRLGSRAVSNPSQRGLEDTVRSTTKTRMFGVPRKSSLKEVVNVLDGTGRFSMSGGIADETAKVTKNVRVQSPHTTDESILPPLETESEDVSVLGNTSRRRRRAASAEGMTSAFILPDITLHNSQFGTFKTSIPHDAGNCTACPPTGRDVTIPTPIPVTEREDPDVTSATVRPAQSPPLALATVLKQLEDEIVHLKSQLAAQQRLYHQHNPALSKQRRLDVNAQIARLTAEIEKRSDQVYALYDVLEGQKQAAVEAEKAAAADTRHGVNEQDVEETLESLGIDPARLSRAPAVEIGRKDSVSQQPPFGFDGADEFTEELPWEGFNDVEIEDEVLPGARRSGVH